MVETHNTTKIEIVSFQIVTIKKQILIMSNWNFLYPKKWTTTENHKNLKKIHQKQNPPFNDQKTNLNNTHNNATRKKNGEMMETVITMGITRKLDLKTQNPTKKQKQNKKKTSVMKRKHHLLRLKPTQWKNKPLIWPNKMNQPYH